MCALLAHLDHVFMTCLILMPFKAAQQSTGSRDTRFLRDEIHQMEKQLGKKDRQLADMEKELEKEKKVNEQVSSSI